MRNLLLILPIICLLITGCQSSRVIVDYDTETDFSNFDHYNWLEKPSDIEKGFDPLIADRIKKAIATSLNNTTLTPASETNKANVLIRYYLFTQIHNQESNPKGSIGFGGGSGGAMMGIGIRFPLGPVNTNRIVTVEPKKASIKARGTPFGHSK